MSFSELGIEPYLPTPKPASEVDAERKLDDLSHQIDMQLEEHKMSRRELGRLFRAVKELYLAHGKRIRGRGWRAFLATKHLKRQTVDSWIIEYELNAGLREAKEPDEDDATNSSLPNFGKLAAPEQSTCSSEQATATSTRVFDAPPLEVEPTYPAAEPTSFLSVLPAAAATSLTPTERLERAMEEVEQATRELIAKELTAPRTIHDFGASYIRCNVQRPVIRPRCARPEVACSCAGESRRPLGSRPRYLVGSAPRLSTSRYSSGQLSIDKTQPPTFHYEVGKRLALSREEGILILGGGNVVHDLHAYARGPRAT